MTGETRKGAAQKSAMFDQKQQFEEEVSGSARRKGQDPSPDDRERGETSDRDKPAATDV